MTPNKGGPAPTSGTSGRSGPNSPGPGGIEHDAWYRWWEHNRDRYLDLDTARLHAFPRSAGGKSRPTSDALGERRAGVSWDVVYGEIVPSILATLSTTEDAFVQRNALLALGRIGEAPARAGSEESASAPDLAPVIAGFLDDDNQMIAEAAVTALGVLGTREAAVVLADFVRDGAGARERCNQHRVPIRTRALAAYGLGLSASRDGDPELDRFVTHTLEQVLAEDSDRHLDLQAACVVSLGLADADRATIEHLLALFQDPRSPDMVRIHAPTALARLTADADPELRAEVARALMEPILRRTRPEAPILRSCVVALGLVGDCDDDQLDEKIRDALMTAVQGRDPIARGLAAVSLAQVAARRGEGERAFAGAREATSFLMKQLARGKSRLRPWAGVALGVLSRELRSAQVGLADSAAEALHQKARSTRSPEEGAAYSVAVGLARNWDAREQVEGFVDRFNDPMFRSHAALSLGLIGDVEAAAALTTVMDDAFHKPLEMQEAALARALLGDPRLVDELLERLAECDCFGSTIGVTRALARTADHRAVAPLLALLEDDERPDWAQALAAEALGWIADKESLPWDARISEGLNYTAAPPTLTHPAGHGILDTM